MMKMNVYCFIFLAAGISCSSIRSSDVESDEVIVLTPNAIDLESPLLVLRNISDKSVLVPTDDDSVVVIPNVHAISPIDLNDDTVAIDISPNETTHDDRGPIMNFFQNIIGNGGGHGGSGPTTLNDPQIVSHDPPTDCEKCSCGIVNKKNRIVGGHETVVNQYPWMGLLQYNNRFYCGCALINDRYVLTAAHCVTGFQARRISVVLLDHNRSKPDETVTITRKIVRSIPHAGYSSTTFNNDIALLRLDKPVEFSSKIRPVCLPPQGKSFTGVHAVATGWGALREGGSISETLQEVSVPIMANRDCRKTGYGSSRITDNMLCAGITKGGKDSCQGDSGGPLHVHNNTLMHIVGVVSWGEGCAQPNYPGVYSRVNRYLTWIRSNTGDSCWCDEDPVKK